MNEVDVYIVIQFLQPIITKLTSSLPESTANSHQQVFRQQNEDLDPIFINNIIFK